MLFHDFYTVKQVSRNGNAFAVNIVVDNDHKVFEGHFPGRPVVLGVFTLQIVKECAELCVGKKLRYDELQNCKFSAIITPDGNDLTIELDYVEGNPAILKAVVKNESIVFFTLKAKIIEPDSQTNL